jgi:hypothetical protein
MRVAPSQIVAIIDRQFPEAHPTKADTMSVLIQGHRPIIVALLDLVDLVPQNLLMVNVEDFAALRMALSAMRSAVEQWTHHDYKLKSLTALNNEHVIRVVRRVMAACPDDAPIISTSGLAFILDGRFRDTLRLDMSNAERAFAYGEWKAATVLAGSAIEALLYWKINTDFDVTQREQAIASARNAGKQIGQPRSDVSRWELHQLAAVAEQLQLIKPDTAIQVDLARGFRNLIHPGVAERTATVCDQGTAHAALAGLHHVVRDLT